MASELKLCPFCGKPMMLREALWPSEGDTDAIIHADKTDCPMFGFGDGSADGSIVEKWNICSSDDEDDFPSDGSCIRCGSVPRNASGLCNTCLDEDAERLENTRPAPATTDTGLETVGEVSTVRESVAAFAGHMSSGQLKPGDLLCLRSQAEKLLAAKDKLIQSLIDFDSEEVKRLEAKLEVERAEKEIAERNRDAARENFLTMQKSAAKLLERAEKAEADNAALIHDLTRIKDHETELVNDNAAMDARIKELENVQSRDGEMWVRQSVVKALEAKLAAAREALEPFADHAKERAVDAPEWRDTDTVQIVVTIGDLRKARAVLGGKP